MKTSDLPDEIFLAAVKQAGLGNSARWAMRSDVEALLPDYPEKIIRAKARRLILRKVIDGCWCGCRGDWTIKGENK